MTELISGVNDYGTAAAVSRHEDALASFAGQLTPRHGPRGVDRALRTDIARASLIIDFSGTELVADLHAETVRHGLKVLAVIPRTVDNDYVIVQESSVRDPAKYDDKW